MTCEERLEALLNRAGQTISDLPKREGTEASEPYPLCACAKANSAAWNWYLDIDDDMDDYDSTRSKFVLKLYILHLTDIIDKLETALENVCGERDYLRKVIEKEVPCLICVTQECRGDDEPCNSCLLPDGETMVNYEYAGVPEDWSADDD